MADIRTTTATISLEPIRLRVAPLIALNLTLALAMLAVGFPAIVSNALRLPSEVVIRAIRDGQPVSKADDDEAVDRLESAAAFSNAARADLAIALLAGKAPPSSAADRVLADHAARQLSRYLDAAPDDAFAWANLAQAEMRRGTAGAAALPFKMSIEFSPQSEASILWRCDFGIDIYAALDDEGKALVAKEFQTAMDPSLDSSISEQVVQIVQRKNAITLARALLANNADASRKFESLLAAKR